jgi:hypothetical protein
MTFVSIYLGIGFASAIAFLVTIFRGASFDDSKAPWILWRLLFVPVIFALAVLVWPGLAGIWIYSRVFESSSDQSSQGGDITRKFHPQKGDLVRSFSIDEIEILETVFDPLGGAPHVPFGHFHTAWKHFLANAPRRAEIWSYSARWDNGYLGWQRREGYVAVMNGKPVAFFQTKIAEDYG